VLVSALLIGCDKPHDGDDFIPEYKEFTAMTFNIRTFNLEEDTPNLWMNRKDRLLATVLKYSPDIVGFQEVRDLGGQLDFLKDNLTDYNWCGNSNYYGSDIALSVVAAETNIVFYKKDRFTLVSWETKWLSETPDVISSGWDEDSTKRTYTRVVLKDNLSGQELNFINTHLDPGAPLSKEKMSKRYSQLAKEDGRPFIIIGDFNFAEGSTFYNFITADTLKDSKHLAAESDTGGTYHSFKGTPSNPMPIDFVYVTESFFDVSSYKIIRDKSDEGLYPSDHFPVFVTLKLKPN